MSSPEEILGRIDGGNRITDSEALSLLEWVDLPSLAHAAHRRRFAFHPEPVVTYVVDRNINYTNICRSECLFCAFYKVEGDPAAYLLSKEALTDKIAETLALGGTGILLQGGIHPSLELSYYTDLLRFIKHRFRIHIHGFSPPEIAFIAEKSALTLEETLKRLVDAGLDSIPGGGAEILSDDVRRRISPGKCSADVWIEVMRTAHRLGLKTSATMMFGHIETSHHVVSHLMRIRSLQDETGGFTAFIPWTFQPENTRLTVRPAGAAAYLRVLAVSRLFLDNVPNLQASWVTQGEKIAQLSLFFGANDIGGTMMEENVVAAAGVRFRLSREGLVHLIHAAGFTPLERDYLYRFPQREARGPSEPKRCG